MITSACGDFCFLHNFVYTPNQMFQLLFKKSQYSPSPIDVVLSGGNPETCDFVLRNAEDHLIDKQV